MIIVDKGNTNFGRFVVHKVKANVSILGPYGGVLLDFGTDKWGPSSKADTKRAARVPVPVDRNGHPYNCVRGCRSETPSVVGILVDRSLIGSTHFVLGNKEQSARVFVTHWKWVSGNGFMMRPYTS